MDKSFDTQAYFIDENGWKLEKKNGGTFKLLHAQWWVMKVRINNGVLAILLDHFLLFFFS